MTTSSPAKIYPHMRPTFVPSPLADQVSAVKRQIAILGNLQHKDRSAHPLHYTIELNKMRSVLLTLEKLKRDEDAANV